ncbi:SIMPL domain-containing protein [Patescibacteria group bacterium]
MAGKRGRPKKSEIKKDIKNIKLPSKKQVLLFLKNNPIVKNAFLIFLVFSVFSLLGLIRIGSVNISEERYITVIGSYSNLEDNDIASFIVTISESNVSKNESVSNVDQKGINLIQAVENFGIDGKDIKTTNNMVYQKNDIDINRVVRLPDSKNTPTPEWVASTSVEIKLRETSKVSEFTSLINSLDGTQIYGPNFTIDTDTLDEGRLLTNAIDDAKEKAKFIAKKHKQRLGDILYIEEISDSSFFPTGEVLGLGGESAQFAPGTTKIEKKVKVRFELK